MSDKLLITFTQSVEVRDHNGKVEFAAEIGDQKELNKASADRWVNRRKAVYGKLDMSESKGDEDKPDDKADQLKKAGEILAKAKDRYQEAFTANQKKGSEETKKELGLASKHQAKKQQEYDALVEESEK